MMGPMTHGVSFPADADGRRSTTRAGRAVVADALRPVDPVGALGAEQETAWRSGYVLHLRRLVEAGVAGPEAWLAIADAGLDAVRRTLVVAADDGSEAPLSSLATAPSKRTLGTVEVLGEGEPQVELVLPYRGRELRGDDLRAQLDAWVARGVMEPSVATAVGLVIDHPEWLRLEGRTVAVLGAGAEMGPLAALLRWGATVAAVDLPRPALWERVQRTARAGAGRLLVPFDASASEDGSFGADLLAEVPEVSDWLAALDGRLVLGNYLYADGGTHVRVAAAADALATRLIAARPDTALAFLATPTDAFVVPREAVEQSTRAYRERSGAAKLVGRPLRWATRGRLLHRAYPPAADPGISDAIVPVQGPNYALAKRIQRWRAAVARRDGHAGVLPRRAVDPDPLGRQEPRPGRRLRRRAPLRRRDLRAGHRQHADGRPARPRPQHRPADARPPVAGRGVRRGARRPVACGVRAPQRARARRGAGLRQRSHLTGHSLARPAPGRTRALPARWRSADRALPARWRPPTGHFQHAGVRRPGTPWLDQPADRAPPDLRARQRPLRSTRWTCWAAIRPSAIRHPPAG